MRDGLHELTGVEVLQLAVELAEGLARHAQHLGLALGGLERDGVFDEVIQPPEFRGLVFVVGVEGVGQVIAAVRMLAQDDVIVPLRRVVEVEPAPALQRALLFHDVLGYEVDIVHHADRVAEDIPVDLLHQKLPDLLAVVQCDVIGRVDVAVGDQPVEDQLPGKTELSAYVGELFLDSGFALHGYFTTVYL